MKIGDLNLVILKHYGTEIIPVLGPKLWIILLGEYKNSTSLEN